jgi:lysophospholipase L1-like esterase
MVARVRTVLCFGDSNTYGAVPTLARVGRHRFAPERRWPGILRKKLGAGWDVVEEGHPSRTTLRDDPIEGSHKNGLRGLPIALESHMPLDLVILMLGTNDLKLRFAASPSDIADSLEVVAKAVLNSDAGPGGAAPAVMIIAPPPMKEVDWLAEMFVGGAAKSLEFGHRFAEVARRCGAAFLDAGAIVESSTVDGIHLESESHRILGNAVAQAVETLFPDGAAQARKVPTPKRLTTSSGIIAGQERSAASARAHGGPGGRTTIQQTGVRSKKGGTKK